MPSVQFYLKKSQNREHFSKNELIEMLSYPPETPEAYQLLAEGRRISEEVSHGKAEVHGQFALNLAPCPKNCMFCSFAVKNGVFKKASTLSLDEAVGSARALQDRGTSAIFIMTTAQYDFGRFLEVVREIKKNLKPETVLVANVGDRNKKEAQSLMDAGFSGVYHALRLGEGRDTEIDPEKRVASIRAFQEAGLQLGTCVEPIGPEHSNEEIADLILFTASLTPAYSGAGRRISIPGTKMSELGMISELRMAQIAAITRMAMPRETTGNCTHEPCVIGAAGGANLFWAEIGANPRDIEEETEKGRGESPEECRHLFEEAGWDVLNGPSVFYGGDGSAS